MQIKSEGGGGFGSVVGGGGGLEIQFHNIL